MITVFATFTGTASLGYVPGQRYELRVRGNTIRRADGTGMCRYGSVGAFLANWNELH